MMASTVSVLGFLGFVCATIMGAVVGGWRLGVAYWARRR